MLLEHEANFQIARPTTGKKILGVPLFFIAPAVIVLAIFTLFPFIYSVRLSFLSWNLIKPHLGKPFVGFSNYTALLNTPRFWNSLRVTCIFVIGSTGISVLSGLGIALLLNQSFRGNTFFRVVFLLPMFITPVVIGIMWRFLLNPELGILNYILGLAGIRQSAWLTNPSLALFTVIMVDTWEWTPLVVLISLSGLQSLPSEPFEAAVVDGAGAWQTFLYITLPSMKRLLATVILIRTMDAFRVFDIIFVTTRGGPGVATENLSIYGYINAFDYFHVGYASTITLVLLVMIIATSILYIRTMKVGDAVG